MGEWREAYEKIFHHIKKGIMIMNISVASLKVAIAMLLISQSVIVMAQEKSSVLEDFATGAAGAAAAMTIYAPFHYFQNRTIQKLPIEKCPTCWFRGLPSLALGKAPTLALQMATYGGITRALQKHHPVLSSREKMFAAVVAGGASGTVNNFTHLIALHQENTGSSFVQTVKQLGLSGSFTRGLGSTMNREILFTYIYATFLQGLKKRIYDTTQNTALSCGAGGLLSGCGVVAITQPFMVITAKLYADMEKKTYKDGLRVALDVAKNEGLRGFYTGGGYRSIGVVLALPVLDMSVEALHSFHRKDS